jgi:multidrug efflux system membrane fusion protein
MDFVENRIEANTATVEGRAIFQNSDLMLTPGQFVRLQLLGSPAHQAVLIPDQAIVAAVARRSQWLQR